MKKKTKRKTTAPEKAEDFSLQTSHFSIPRLRFPEFRGELGWSSKRLDKVGRLIRGLTYSAKDVAEDGLLVLRATNIQNDHLVLNKDLVFVEKECNDEQLIRKGDIAICMSNGSKALVGKNAEYKGDYDNALTVGAFCSIFRPDDSFAKYLLQTPQYTRFIAVAIGGGNINNLRPTDLESLKFPIPPTSAEQLKIAECLSSLDGLIAAEGRKWEALKAHKKGLMQQLFPQPGQTQPRLRFPEFRDKGEWGESPLGKLLSRKPEYGVNAAAVPFSEDLPIYIRITDIDDEGQFAQDNRVSVDIEPTEENYLVEGDIVLARTGASVGKSYRYRENDGRLVFAGFLIRVRPNPKKLVPDFLSNYLTTWQYWDWVRVNSARSGQPGINGSEYASMPVPLPQAGPKGNELAEQHRIAACLTSLDDQITAQAAKIESLNQHKRGLMQQLFPSPEEQ